MDGLSLEIISLDGKILEEDGISIVTVETTGGPIGILKKHANLLTSLRIGILTYRDQKDRFKRVALGVDGVAEVFKNKVTIFVTTAEASENIDILRARKAKERALERLNQSDHFNEERLEIALKKALVRLTAAESETFHDD